MKPPSAADILLLTGFACFLPQSTWGAPVIQAAEVSDSHITARDNDFSRLPIDQADGAETVSRNEHAYHLMPFSSPHPAPSFHDSAPPSYHTASTTHIPGPSTYHQASLSHEPIHPTYVPNPPTHDPTYLHSSVPTTHEAASTIVGPPLSSAAPPPTSNAYHDPSRSTHNPAPTMHDPASTMHDPASTMHNPAPTMHGPAPPSPPGWKPIPNTENPGKGAGVGSAPKPMKEYETAGKKQMKTYQTIVKEKGNDTHVVHSEAGIHKFGKKHSFMSIRAIDGYKIKEDLNITLEDLPALKAYTPKELGFDPMKLKSLTKMTVFPKDGKSGEVASEAYFDPNGKIIVFSEEQQDVNSKINDHVPISEQVAQNFLNVAGDNTKNFDVAVRYGIRNKEVYAVVRENYNDNKKPFSKVLTFQKDSPQFNRLMGVPNIYSKFYSFADHHNAIDNKLPNSITVFPRQAKGSDDELTIAVLFKKS